MPVLAPTLRPRRSDTLLRWAFVPYFRGLFRRRFAGLYVEGALPDTGPVLVLANHAGWWDGPLGLLLTALDSPLDGYVAMEAATLRRHPAFRRAGCFGIDRDHPGRALAALSFAGGLLADPAAAVWVFPQGRMRHVEARPLGFEGGLAVLPRFLVADAGVRVVHASFRYEAGGEDRPDAHVAFSPARPLPPDARRAPRDWLAAEERALTVHLDAHRAHRVRGDRGRLVLAGSAGVDRAWDRARGLDARAIRGEAPHPPPA